MNRLKPQTVIPILMTSCVGCGTHHHKPEAGVMKYLRTHCDRIPDCDENSVRTYTCHLPECVELVWHCLLSIFSLSKYMSLCVRKPTICIGENIAADQLFSNCTADQRLCFRSKDRTILLLLKSEISSL